VIFSFVKIARIQFGLAELSSGAKYMPIKKIYPKGV